MTLEFSEIQLKQRGTRSGPTMAFFFEKISDDGWLAGTFNFLPSIYRQLCETKFLQCVRSLVYQACGVLCTKHFFVARFGTVFQMRES